MLRPEEIITVTRDFFLHLLGKRQPILFHSSFLRSEDASLKRKSRQLQLILPALLYKSSAKGFRSIATAAQKRSKLTLRQNFYCKKSPVSSKGNRTCRRRNTPRGTKGIYKGIILSTFRQRAGIKLIIAALLLHQILMIPPLNDPALIQY